MKCWNAPLFAARFWFLWAFCNTLLCKKHGTTLIRAALNFPLGHEAITAIIPGFSNVAEFRDNMAGYRLGIPDALWDELKAEGLLHKDAPGPVTPVL